MQAKPGEENPGRAVTSFAPGRSVSFFQIAKILEQKLQHPCGIEDRSYMDEYEVDSQNFLPFFEKFMSYEWEGEGVEHLYNWAANAAGVVANTTFEFRLWKTPDGKVLPAQRCMLSESPLEEQTAAKGKRHREEIEYLPQVLGALDNRFDYLSTEHYARIISETQIDDRK